MKFRAFFSVLAIVLAWPLLGYLERWLQGGEAGRPHPDYDVVLFVTPACASCDRARALLQEEQVRFFEYDVQASEEGLRKFEALGGMAAPLIVVRDRVIQGYNEKALQEALKTP